MVMAYYNIYGICILAASLLGFIFLYRSMKKTTSKKKIASSGLSSQPVDTGETDVIIVGAGVAGAALAYTLGKDGRRVHVIERDLTEPDRIAGEFMQPGGYLKLVELGLQDCLDEIEFQRVDVYVFHKDGKIVNLPLPSGAVGGSFHNGRFVQKLRQKASTISNVRMEQGTVTSLLEENGTIKGVQYKKAKDSQETAEALAPLTIVCDGSFSNLRSLLCNPKVNVHSSFVGLVLENCRLPHPNHAHLVLGDPSLAIFYPIGDNEIRCLVDVPRQKVPSISNGEMEEYLKSLVAPQVPPELREAFIAAIEKGEIRTMMNRSMPADPIPMPGAIVMGDAFNMRHPLTGAGMTVALSDVVVLRDLLRRVGNLNCDDSGLSKYLESFYTLRKPAAFTINAMAGVLYEVFQGTTDPARREMSRICYNYLSLGAVFADGFMSLFTCLKPNPLGLVILLFSMVAYGVVRFIFLNPFPWPKQVRFGVRLITVAASIVFPIVKDEGVKQVFFPALVPAYYRAPPS